MDKQNNNEIKNNIKTESDIISNTIDQYIIEQKLGEGIFGTVKLATHKITKEKVAIKLLNKNKITKAEQTLLSRELLILKKMNHFNIIKLYSIIETESIIYLVQEYSSGSELSNYINYHSKTDEKEICKFFQQIISGVEYIHSMGIAHRDLKPENILLNRSNDIKIIDFGLSNIYKEGQLLKTSCGSPYYAPPEMLQGKPYNGLYSDIYSCGIILYYMLTKKLPFNENNNTELYKKKIEGKFNIPKNISKDAQDLLKKIIKVKPEERIKIKDIKKHPWFKLADINYNMHSGLNCDKIIFPIDNEIIKNMTDLGFNSMEVRYNIIKNEHNNITTTYYLLLDKKCRKGRKSIADLHSNLFDDYINDPKNKIENYEGGIDQALKERINSKGIIKTIPDFEVERQKLKNKLNNRRRSSVKKNVLRNISSGKENKELSNNIKLKMKMKLDILNKKENNSSIPKIKFNENSNNTYKNKSRHAVSAKIKPNKNIKKGKNISNKTIEKINKEEINNKDNNNINVDNNINNDINIDNNVNTNNNGKVENNIKEENNFNSTSNNNDNNYSHEENNINNNNEEINKQGIDSNNNRDKEVFKQENNNNDSNKVIDTKNNIKKESKEKNVIKKINKDILLYKINKSSSDRKRSQKNIFKSKIVNKLNDKTVIKNKKKMNLSLLKTEKKNQNMSSIKSDKLKTDVKKNLSLTNRKKNNNKKFTTSK